MSEAKAIYDRLMRRMAMQNANSQMEMDSQTVCPLYNLVVIILFANIKSNSSCYIDKVL